MSNIGFIHGRFQPFHNGHLKYLQSALEQSETIWVGITKIDLGVIGQLEGHERRDQADANPLNYYQRATIIRECVADSGLDKRIIVAPFPIENTDRCPYFISTDLTAHTTIKEEWNREKIRRLEGVGYSINVLTDQPWVADNIASGSEIREMIRSNSPNWQRYVPPATARLITSEFVEAFPTSTP